MPDSSDLPSARPAGDPILPVVAERVRLRLDRAGLAYDRRASASLPHGRRRKPPKDAALTNSPDHPLHARERACLRAVFHELGDTHRRYRAETGQSVSPALRAATAAFKQEPSLLSLVPVVAFFDDLGLLPW